MATTAARMPVLEVVFEVPGPPTPKERARHGQGRTYKTAKSSKAEMDVAFIAASARPSNWPHPSLRGAVVVEMLFFFNATGVKGIDTLVQKPGAPWWPHTLKPDTDNLEKHILDALKGILWLDDCTVARTHPEKLWHPSRSTTFVRVRPWTEVKPWRS